MRLKFDYELVANENAYESKDFYTYYSYFGVAYGKSEDEVNYLFLLNEEILTICNYLIGSKIINFLFLD